MSLQHLHHTYNVFIVTIHPFIIFWFPPPLVSIAFSQSSFSRLTALFLRVQSSTARFLLHRKFVRLRVRSVSRVTWAPTGGGIEETYSVVTNVRTAEATGHIHHSTYCGWSTAQPSAAPREGAEFSGWSHLGASCAVLLLRNLPGTVGVQLHSFPEDEK